MTNGEILKLFHHKYPEMSSVDYRPLCPECFTKDLVGITIWLDNGDVLQYYPKEAQRGDKMNGDIEEIKRLYRENCKAFGDTFSIEVKGVRYLVIGQCGIVRNIIPYDTLVTDLH